MEERVILYEARIESFSKRIFKLFYPHALIALLFLVVPFFNKAPYNFITAIWVTIMALITTMNFVSSYKWALNQIISLTFHDDLFEIEIISNNTRLVYKVEKSNIRVLHKWQGGRPRILKLSLFDGDFKITDLYSGGNEATVNSLEGIAYKINKYKAR